MSGSESLSDSLPNAEMTALIKGRYFEELNSRYDNGQAKFDDLHRQLVSIVLDELSDYADAFEGGTSNFKMDYDNRTLKVKAGENRWIVFQLSPTHVVDDNDDLIETS